jgi:hypothetical protein
MKTKLFIPEKIKVGYQKREGTYTKKLAYVIYYDNKGVLRKETSWQSWRDKKIPADDFENKPIEGFVLNKGVGGTRESYGWNARNEYIRVYDPRGFEFEISVANLLFILQEATSTRGKGLEGEFVYSWDGKELVLLPVDCNDYKECVNFTGMQSKKMDAKNMVPGCIYKFKDMQTGIYLGRHNFKEDIFDVKFKKYHIFYNQEKFEHRKWGFPVNYRIEDGFTKIAQKVTDVPVDNYAELLEKYLNSFYATKCVGLVDAQKEITETYVKNITSSNSYNERYLYLKWNDLYYQVNFGKSWDKDKEYSLSISYRVSFENGELKREYERITNPFNIRQYNHHCSFADLQKYTFYNLYALLENKQKVKL